MNKDHWVGIVIIFCIISILAFGGVKNTNRGAVFSNEKSSDEQGVKKTNTQTETVKKNESLYKDVVSLSHISRSEDPKGEYAVIKASGNLKNPVLVSGWKLKSLRSGESVTIPKGTYLYFTGMQNTEDDIYLNGGDTLYIVTSISPNGASFKLNKCSGYLQQFQTFTPSLNTNCPSPRNEDLSSIPDRVINDACFDYIKSFPSCRIETNTLPANWSHECTTFISTKINYPTCVNAHKNDKDFYQPEWRVYLKRSASLWKNSHENIALYDSNGKVVNSLSY